jgi:short-subunit dehydrogenase
LVTGASKGIGRATAERLAARGYSVFGTSRQPEGKTAKGFTLLPLDVRDDQSVSACIQAVIDRAGKLDILINNAGVVLNGAVEEASVNEAKALFETNFFGVIRMVNTVLPIFRAQRSGHIVNMSSLAGLVGAPYLGLYAASKHALEGYSESLRYELRQFGIYVSLVAPGDIHTDIDKLAVAPALSISDYDGVREQATAIHLSNVENGPEPDVVAEVILKLIAAKSPPVRRAIAHREQVFVPIMRRLLPPFLVEWIIRDAYKLPGTR